MDSFVVLGEIKMIWYIIVSMIIAVLYYFGTSIYLNVKEAYVTLGEIEKLECKDIENPCNDCVQSLELEGFCIVPRIYEDEHKINLYRAEILQHRRTIFRLINKADDSSSKSTPVAALASPLACCLFLGEPEFIIWSTVAALLGCFVGHKKRFALFDDKTRNVRSILKSLESGRYDTEIQRNLWSNLELDAITVCFRFEKLKLAIQIVAFPVMALLFLNMIFTER